MLITCKECKLQVSDKAMVCPHCGYPMQNKSLNKPANHSPTKKRRLPNGFGQISEIKNQNLRERFRVMVTVGKTSTGKCITKILKPKGYFKTYNEAYMALVEYNKNPYDLDSDITVAQLYEKWTNQYFEEIKASSVRSIKSAWQYCTSLYDMRAKDIRARHIKQCMEDGEAIINGEKRIASAGTKERIKSMFNLMFDYALEYEIVDKNYARTFKLSKDIFIEQEKAKNCHITFSDSELDALWKHVNDVAYVDIILIQCYTGWRPQELGLLKISDIDFENGLLKGGMKTDAGENRIVPIHPKIKDLIVQRYNEAIELNSEYLLNCTDGATHLNNIKLTYDKYRHRFEKIIKRLNLNPEHRAHDGRVTFITRAKKFHVDEYALKYIVGHAITDITEKVYTKREISWLIEEMQKIK